MTTRQLKYIYLFVIAIPAFNANAQESLPEVGKPLKDYTFHDVANYKTKTASLSDWLGKWLFLQFWYTGCTDNIKMFPTLRQYEEALRDRVNFVLVVPNHDIYKNAPTDLAKVQKKFKTRFTVAFDSILHRQLSIWAMPYFLLVDPDGIIRAMSDGHDVNIEKLKQVLAGGKPDFIIGPRYTRRYEYLKYNSEKDSSVLFKSVLSRHTGETPSGVSIARYAARPLDHPEGIMQTGTTLLDLYKMAYLEPTISVKRINGEWMYPYPVIEAKDKKFSVHDSLGLGHESLYNYNLFINPSMQRKPDFIRVAMQADLKGTFGYDVSIEKREIPVWRLFSKPGAAEKLKTPGGGKFIWRGPMSITVRNVSVDTFRELIIYSLSSSENVFLDENELDYAGNIDVTIEALTTDIQEMQSALEKFGFMLMQEKITMNVLVIQDSKEK